MNLANEVNKILRSLGWDDLRVVHYFNSVELYDGFVICEGDQGQQHEITTVKVDHSQIESGESTPQKIAYGIIDYISIEQTKTPHIIARISNEHKEV